MKNIPLLIAGQKILPGSHANLTLPAADLYTQTKITIPVHVFHGKKAGPRFFVTSALHGDEINSIEILRRLHAHKALRAIHGTLITVPVVNIQGFILQSRYLQDRRDLNRSFPGKKSGSLAARLAHLLMEEIVSKCQYGIDLHTGAYGRSNMPQLRVHLKTPQARQLAYAFDVPVILDAKIREGSLRAAAIGLGIPLLVYEAGEALRYDELCIRAGVRGILNVLNYLGMIQLPPKQKKSKYQPVIARTSQWVRAVTSGLMQPLKEISASVRKGEKLALIHDPFLINPTTQCIVAPFNGIIVGRTNLPLVNEGDGMYNIASVKKIKMINAYIEETREEIEHLS